ncbi:MAG: hypothetical protein RML36_06055 [Anaerolineae bacterium]|nr:hypothetical protein [Anaerolineae bacterium]
MKVDVIACKPLVSRRAFLTGAAISFLGALAACSRGAASTPAPAVAARPTWTATPSIPPLAATDTLTPTETPTVTATPTRPRPTPTPTATPFPPGPPTKLGLFVTRNDPALFDLIGTRNVALVKTLELDANFVRQIKEISPDTLIVGRIYLPQLDLSTIEPLAEARRFVEQLLPIAGDPERMKWFDAWEAYNEPVPTDPTAMRRLADFEAERTRLLAQAGIRSVIGNFGTGHPPLELWPDFLPAVQAVKEYHGYLGLHEYSAPTMQFGTGKNQLDPSADEGDEGWLTLRYRKVYRRFLIPSGLVVPLLITECGIDGTVANRPGPPGRGWKDFVAYWAEIGMGEDGPGNYIEQLAWYDSELYRDEYVKGAAIFAAAASKGWESYEILGEPALILRQYLSVHPVR